MKILFIDDESIQNSIRVGLLEQTAHHVVHLVSDMDDAVAAYINESPDIVIIDFTISHGLDTMYKILEINPHQRIITLSDSADCTELLGCEYCLDNYCKRRLLKHQPIHDLMYLIDNFDTMPCEYANRLNAHLPEEDISLDDEG